jgi:hypothetical protein
MASENNLSYPMVKVNSHARKIGVTMMKPMLDHCVSAGHHTRMRYRLTTVLTLVSKGDRLQPAAHDDTCKALHSKEVNVLLSVCTLPVACARG